MSLMSFLLIYIFGGLTFLPLLGGIILIVMFPPWALRIKKNETIKFDDVSQKDFNSAGRDDSSYHKFGWLRITREFDLPNNGSNGSTFGNIMKQGIASFMDSNNNKQNLKRTKDSFFAVLKYNNLFMYDSERQLNCKGIIIVSNHDVMIYPEQLPDNEIFTKANSIRLTKKQSICAQMNLENNNGCNTTYYLFCDNGVDKEDWYFSLQRSSKLKSNDNSTGQQINKDKSLFDPFAMNHLLKTLDSNDDHIKTQWLNAILGRIFLSVYKTQAIKDYFIRKLVKKIKKVKKPGFLSDIHIKSVDVGDGIPYITNPELGKLLESGELNVDINLNYTGGFRVEIETEAIIPVTRLKTIKVRLILAVVLRGLQGKMLLRIKSPPTNRLWMGFYEMPKLDLLIEPVVSETQLKFAPIINAIESKIHEMITESLVLPNMDDTPFFNSFGMGGIYEGEVEQQSDTQTETETKTQLEIPPLTTPISTPSLTDTEKESSKSNEDEESIVAAVPDIQSIPTANEELLKQTKSSPAILESTKPDTTVESSKIEVNLPVDASDTTENNSFSSSWTSRATRINKRLSAFHDSFSEPNLLKNNTSRLRSISRQFMKHRADDSSTVMKEATKEPIKDNAKENGENKEPLPSSNNLTNSPSTTQNTTSSTSALRRWSQSVNIRRRTANIASIISNNNGNSGSNNNSNKNVNNTASNTSNTPDTSDTSDASNITSNNTESDAQKSQNSISITSSVIDPANSADKQDPDILIEKFSPLSSSPQNIPTLNTPSTKDDVLPTLATTPSRSTSTESLNLTTYKSSSHLTTIQNDIQKATPTPPPSPPKSPKEPPDIFSSSPSSSIKSTSSFIRDSFLSENNSLRDDEFFPDIAPSILNTPVEELNRVLG